MQFVQWCESTVLYYLSQAELHQNLEPYHHNPHHGHHHGHLGHHHGHHHDHGRDVVVVMSNPNPPPTGKTEIQRTIML